MTNYLIVGQGVAGATAAEHIRKHDATGPITMITDEDTAFYWRLQLIEFIAGELGEQALLAKDPKWYADRSIEVRLKTRATDADPERRVVIIEDGQEIPYDRLLVATGSHSFMPPIKGYETPGVFTLRSLQDARDIRKYAEEVQQAVLIGGGLLGLETAYALQKAGVQCMVVEFFPRLLPRQLDSDGADKLQRLMEEQMGLRFRLGAKTQEIQGNGRVTGVVLEGGEVLEAQMVVVSAGVRPNLELAKSLGLDADKGIRVDERLRTSRADVFAAGDVVEFQGMVYGIWPAAMEQGKVAGMNMAGADAVYKGTTMANTLKVVGIDLASAGNIDAENALEHRVVSEKDVYKKIVLEDNVITGCILLGDTSSFGRIKKMMEERTDVSALKDTILE